MNKINKKAETNIGVLIMLFIGIVVAIALINPIADTTGQMTTKQSTDNQSISTVTGFVDGNEVDETVNYSIYSQSDWKVISCPLESVAIRNGVGTALVADTDYTLDAANGRFSLLNTTKTVPDTALNLTYADYTYCADGYNTNSGSRTIANLVVIFSALAILGFVALGLKREWF